MTSSIILASAQLAEESHHVVNELPIPPLAFAGIFMVTFVLLAFVTASFSGRGIPRSEAGPAELSAEEREVLADYQREYR